MQFSLRVESLPFHIVTGTILLNPGTEVYLSVFAGTVDQSGHRLEEKEILKAVVHAFAVRFPSSAIVSVDNLEIFRRFHVVLGDVELPHISERIVQVCVFDSIRIWFREYEFLILSLRLGSGVCTSLIDVIVRLATYSKHRE